MTGSPAISMDTSKLGGHAAPRPLDGPAPPFVIRRPGAARIALAGVLLAAVALLAPRPMGPWWLSADCDASYLGSALNLYAGYPTEYYGHPGMPLQTLLTLTIAVDHAVQSLIYGVSRDQYVDGVFLDMSRGMWMNRLWAMAFFLFALAVAFEIGRRWAGHWVWGIAAAVMYAAVPGAIQHATTCRPENVLSPLCLLIVHLVANSKARRSVGPLVAATFLLGLTITVKVHAIGLVPLVAWALWSARRHDWPAQTWASLNGWLRARPRLTYVALSALALLVVGSNAGRDLSQIDPRAPLGVALLLAWLLLTLLVQRRRFAECGMRNSECGMKRGTTPPIPHSEFRIPHSLANPVWPIAALLGLAGVILPNAMFLDQLVPMCRVLWWSMTGQGYNAGFEWSQLPAAVVRQWSDGILTLSLPMAALAAAGVLRGLFRRVPGVWLWAAAAGSMFLLAGMRGAVHPSPHHYAPAVTLMIPLVLTLFWNSECGIRNAELTVPHSAFRIPHSAFSRYAPIGLALIAAVCIRPIVWEQRLVFGNAERCHAIAAATLRLTPRLAGDQFIMTDYWAQNADAAHFFEARDCCYYTPEMNYRSLPDAPPALRYAAHRGLSPAYYLTYGTRFTRVTPDDAGRLTATSVWGRSWTVRRLETIPLAGAELNVYEVLP